MASRLIKQNVPILSRMHSLIKLGIVREPPVWLKVLERFPPPKMDYYPTAGKPPKLSYPSDKLRQRFWQCYQPFGQQSNYIQLLESRETFPDKIISEKYIPT